MKQIVQKIVSSIAIASILFSPVLPMLEGQIAHAAVSVVTVTPATGGSAIPASSAGGAWTTLTGPVISETDAGQIGNGSSDKTIILNAPTGFVFDTTGSAPTVLISRIAGSGGLSSHCNINDKASGTSVAITSRTATTITFTVTEESRDIPSWECGGNRNSLTWQNIRVRPSASSPLRTGNITASGTATIDGVSGSTNFGTLTMVADTLSLSNSTVTASPTSTVVGSTSTITITLKSDGGAPVQEIAGNIVISATGSDNTITKISTSTDASGVFIAKIYSTKAESKTISVNILPTGMLSQTATVVFTPGAPAQADIASSATSSVVGNPVDLTLNLKDKYNNIVADGSSVTLLASIGTVTGTSTTVGGVLTRQLNSTVTGVSTLSFSDLVSPGTVTGTTSVLFLPGPAAQIVITTQPSTTQSVDYPFTAQPVMTVKDQYGNNVADGTIVTANPVSPATGLLRNISVTTVSGVATYGLIPTTQLGYSKSGETFQIKFIADSAEATSDPLGPLTNGVITKITPVADPSTLFAGATSNITIYGQDQFGNTVVDSSVSGFIIANNGLLGSNIFTLSSGVAGTTLTKDTPGSVLVTPIVIGLTSGETTVMFTQSDVTAPEFVSASPTLGATDVAISAPLFLNFSEALKNTTVNSSNVWLVNASTSESVPATVSLVEGGTRVQITPNNPLEYSTQYYFRATTGITDEAGNALASEVTSEVTGFTTQADESDHTAPTVVAQYPEGGATGVALTVNPFIDFSESMKASTLVADNVQLRTVSDDAVIPSDISVINGGTRVVIAPQSQLSYATAYYLFISTTVTDEAGNALASEYNGKTGEAEFTTMDAPVEEVPLAISNVQVTDITTSGATITWTTNKPATSQVEFGLTGSYGSQSDLDTATSTSHSVILSGLAANSLYHFRVKSKDAPENEVVSEDATFTTAFDDTATLHVTAINQIKTFATADDTFENGWRWVFDVTVPTPETNVFMKFSDLLGSPTGTILAASNIRFFSEQASNATNTSSAIVVSAADTFAGPLEMTTDMSPATPGRQVQIVVDVKVPVGTPGGSYSTNYGIKSEAPFVPEVE